MSDVERLLQETDEAVVEAIVFEPFRHELRLTIRPPAFSPEEVEKSKRTRHTLVFSQIIYLQYFYVDKDPDNEWCEYEPGSVAMEGGIDVRYRRVKVKDPVSLKKIATRAWEVEMSVEFATIRLACRRILLDGEEVTPK